MKNAINRALSSTFLCVPVYTFSSFIARGDDWGRQVLLRLSNPGGTLQYPECRPPTERLWSHLAIGRTFPICSGVGFTATKPRHAPYFFDAGLRLVARSGDRENDEVGCVSTEPQVVSAELCRNDDGGVGAGNFGSAGWDYSDGVPVCKARVTARPHVREQPRYIDLTIDVSSRQRMWF